MKFEFNIKALPKMKKIAFITLLLFFTQVINGQIINFPDLNFKAVLVASSTSNGTATGVGSSPLQIDANSDGEIQISEGLMIQTLVLDNNAAITDLTGIENFTNLIDISSKNCSITFLNFTGMTALVNIDCGLNPLTSVAISNLPNLQNCLINNANLNSLDLTGLSSLGFLRCSTNQLSQLDVTGIPNITSLECNANLLSTLDVSSAKLLNYLVCSDNQLTLLNLKNGRNQTITCSNNPGLIYVCEDDEYTATTKSTLSGQGYTTLSVNAYCSFTPGGNYNTLGGKYIFDDDNNGCDAFDVKKVKFQKLEIDYNGTYSATFTDDANEYIDFGDSGTFQMLPTFEDFPAFNFNPVGSSVYFADDLNNNFSQDYCITSNGIHPDVEVVISPLMNARPGFDVSYQIIIKNKGNQTLSGTTELNYNDNKVDFISSDSIPTLNNTGHLEWNYSDLLPFETRKIELLFHVNNTLQTPPVNIGDTLTYSVAITPTLGDDIPEDNQFTFQHVAVSSLTPNQFICLEGSNVPETAIGNYLHYAILFENPYDTLVTNVVVKEFVDSNRFDIRTLELLHGSDTMYTKILNHRVEHFFQNMALGDHNHGNILLKMKVMDTITVTDTVSGAVEIYFDYALPIATDSSKTTFNKLLSLIPLEMLDLSINVYPNPSNGLFYIETDNSVQSVEIFDEAGRLIIVRIGKETIPKIDLSLLEKGQYYAKITTKNGVKVVPIQKE